MINSLTGKKECSEGIVTDELLRIHSHFYGRHFSTRSPIQDGYVEFGQPASERGLSSIISTQAIVRPSCPQCLVEKVFNVDRSRPNSRWTTTNCGWTSGEN